MSKTAPRQSNHDRKRHLLVLVDDKGADEDVDAEDDDADGDDQHGEVVHGETIVEGVEDMGAGCERDVSFAEHKN